MAVEELPPPLVPEPGGMAGRVDDVGEQNGGQDALRRACLPGAGDELLDLAADLVAALREQQVVSPRELDELGAGNLIRQVAPQLDRHRTVLGPVEDQRWGADHG